MTITRLKACKIINNGQVSTDDFTGSISSVILVGISLIVVGIIVGNL